MTMPSVVVLVLFVCFFGGGGVVAQTEDDDNSTNLEFCDIVFFETEVCALGSEFVRLRHDCLVCFPFVIVLCACGDHARRTRSSNAVGGLGDGLLHVRVYLRACRWSSSKTQSQTSKRRAFRIWPTWWSTLARRETTCSLKCCARATATRTINHTPTCWSSRVALARRPGKPNNITRSSSRVAGTFGHRKRY